MSFGEPHAIEAVKVFGTAPYALRLRDGDGHEIAAEIDLREGDDGAWNLHLLPETVTLAEVTLDLEAYEAGGEVGDIELWAAGPARPIAYAPGIESGTEPGHVDLVEASPASLILGPEGERELCGAFRVELPRHPGSYRRMWLRATIAGAHRPFALTRAINEHSMIRAHWAPGADVRSYVQPIDPELLFLGSNEVHYCVPAEAGAEVTIEGVELLGELDHGSNFIESATVAPYDAAPTRSALELLADAPAAVTLGASEELVLAFDRLVSIDAILLDAPGSAEWTARCVDDSAEAHPVALAETAEDSGDAALGTLRVTSGGERCAGLRLSRQGGGVIDGVRVFGSGAARRVDFPQVVIASPLEHFGYQAWVEGWVRAPSRVGGGVAVRVDAIASSGPDGIFGHMLTRSSDPGAAWVVTVRGRLADGKEVSRQVVLDRNAGALPGTNGLEGVVDDGLTEAERAERYGRDGERAEESISSGGGGRVALGTHVAVDIPAGALNGQKNVSITHLGASSVPPLDPGMVNVTAPFAHGYEFLPHGEQFNAGVTITLPYQPNLVPEGYTVHDIETWFYDEDQDRWARLARDEVDSLHGVVKSLTDHFTVMINAIVVTPEHPQAASFDGNRIRGLEAAHPGAGITMIEPPSANGRGDANLQYPLVVPPGRRGMQPELALTYSSGAGNGWLGVGWDLPISAISVDTRFGVPRYDDEDEDDEALETETYLLDGEQLAPTAHHAEFVPRTAGPKRFWRRAEQDFERIVRFGTHPTNYYWVVTAKDGSRRYYGRGDDETVGANERQPATIGSADGIFRWYLREVVDTFGNRIRYDYALLGDEGPNDRRSLVPTAIHYTLADSEDDGVYQVHFCRDAGDRPDPILSARGGFLEHITTRLERIEVHYEPTEGAACKAELASSVVRGWELAYHATAGDPATGYVDPFGKSRLASIQQLGRGGVAFEGARHDFTYFDDVRAGADYRGFGAVRASTSVDAPDIAPIATTIVGGIGRRITGAGDLDLPGNAVVNSSVLGGTRTVDASTGIYIGINPVDPRKTLSGGVSLNASFAQTSGLASLYDVDGDGLPDHVFCDRDSCAYNRNLGVIDGEVQFADAAPLEGFRSIQREQSFSFGVGPQIHAGAQFFYNFGLNVSATRVYVADVNGDGLPDQVEGGDVRFGYYDTAASDDDLEAAQIAYSPRSSDSPVRLGGSSSAALDPEELAELEDMIREMTPAEDALRLWRAPYDGTVRLRGRVRLARALEAPDDGVLAIIEVARPSGDSSEVEGLYLAELGPSGATSANPDLTVDLRAGDHLVFRVHARDDGLHDEVEWAPVVEYTNLAAGTDLAGLDVRRYSSAQDFVPFGGGYTVGLPYSGRVRFTGSVEKLGVTNDGAWLEILENEVVVQRRWIDADDTGVVDVSFEHSVEVDPFDPDLEEEDEDVEPKMSNVTVRLASRVPVDLRKFRVHEGFAVTYLEATDEEGEPVPTVDDEGEPQIVMPIQLDARTLVPASRSEGGAVVPAAPTVLGSGDDESEERNVNVRITTFSVDELPHEFWLTATIDGRVTHAQGVANDAYVPGEPAPVRTVTATWTLPMNRPVSFAVSGSRSTAWQLAFAFVSYQLEGETEWRTLPFAALAAGAPGPFSAPYRGWRMGSIRPGENPEALTWLELFGESSCSSAFEGLSRREARKKARRMRRELGEDAEERDPEPDGGDHDEENPYVLGAGDAQDDATCEDVESVENAPEARRGPMRPVHLGDGCPEDPSTGVDDFPVDRAEVPEDLRCPPLDPPHWRGLDDRVYLTATRMSASRLGPDRLPIERTIAGGGGGSEDGNGRGVVRFGNTITNSFGGGVQASILGANASLGRTASRSWVDFRDLNGDGLPDVVRPDQVRFTTPIGALESFSDVCVSCERGARSSSVTGAVGFGAQSVGQRGNARGQEGGTAPHGRPGNPNNDAGWGSFNFSAGLNAGISRNDRDLVDVNGDGLPDRVREERGNALQPRKLFVQLNLGYRFAPEEYWGEADIHRSSNFEVNAGLGYTSRDQGWNVGVSGSMSRSQVRTPNPILAPLVIPPHMLPFFEVGNANAENSTLLDVNGDGLVDVVSPDEHGLRVRFNTGTGFADQAVAWGGGSETNHHRRVEVSELDSFSVSANAGFTYGPGPLLTVLGLIYIPINPNFSLGTSDSRPKVAVQDIDGDGAPDHLRSLGPDAVDVALNNTRRTGLLATIRRPMGSSFAIDYGRAGNTRAMPEHRWVMSSVVVHDGVADTVEAGDESDFRIQTFAYEGGRYDRREREFLGFAKVTTTDLNTVGYTVGSLPTAAYRSVEQELHNATIFDDGLPRRTRSFDHSSGSAILQGVEEASYELRDPSGAKMAEFDASGLEPSESVLASEWLQVVQRTSTRVSYEAGSSEGVATMTSQDVDGYGNVTRYSDAGSLTTATDDHVATIGYAACGGDALEGAYIVGVPKTISVRDLEGRLLRERSSDIDCADGVPNSVSTRLNDQEWATTTLAYTSSGQLHVVTSPSGGAKTYELTFGYDAFIGAHVTSVTDSFGYASSAAFDPHLGLVQTRDTDINGQTVSTTYDSFGRPTSVTGPYEQGEGVVTIAYDYHPTGETPWAHTANYDELAPRDPIETFTFTDGLGRVLQTKKDGTVFAGVGVEGGSRVRIVSGRVQYDPWGRALKTWHPRTELLSAAGGLMEFEESETAGPTVVRYDAQDRVASTTLPDGSVTTQSYAVEGAGFGALLRTDVVDAEGKRRTALRDARGLIREVRELLVVDETPRVQSTTYDYNAVSELVKVLDAAENPTLVEYDLAGRRISIDNRDTGKTVLRCDLAGNVVVRETAALRARGQAIRYVYDRTHLVQVDHPGNEADVVYEWGGAAARPGQRGRITRILDAGGTLEREYGPLGEVVTETRHLYRHNQTPPTLRELFPEGAPTDDPVAQPQGPRLTTRYRYDTWGRLHELVYPDGEVVRYGYDSGGLVRSATGVKLGVEYPYVNRLEYDEFGQRVFEELGNGIRSHYTYDEETRRLATLSAGEFQNLEYGYDRVGNVTSLVNDVGPLGASERGGRVSQSFIYDDLHRLESATGEWTEPGGARNRYTLSLGYDAIHNLTHKTQTHTVGRGSGSNAVTQRRTTYDFDYEYAGTQPHAPTRVGERSFGYDASGRQVTVTPDQGGPRRTVLWDSEDRIRAIQDGGAAVLDEHGNVVDGRGRTTAFTYDHTGQRITKSGAQGHTAYVNPFYTLRNETIATKHVFVGAARVTSKLVPGEGADELPTETDDVAHYLGRWWQHRSDEGWEHASNVEMNPHYRVPTEMPSPMGLPESNFVYFYHPDHLGSTSFVTDGGGEIYEHVQYLPQGEVWADERSNTERLPYLFTGKEMDQETGLYDFGARMYDPRVGLWASPDPALPEFLAGDGVRGSGVFEPRSLSLVSYAAHNPVAFVDPDGRDVVLADDGYSARTIEGGVEITFALEGGAPSTPFVSPSGGSRTSPRMGSSVAARESSTPEIGGFAQRFAENWNSFVESAPNLVKMGVGVVNFGRGISGMVQGGVALAAGGTSVALPIVGEVTGPLAGVISAYKFYSGAGLMIRGVYQFGESINEPLSHASFRNLCGLLPSGQHVDDPNEPLPMDYYRFKFNQIAARPISGTWDAVREYFSPGR